MNEAVTERAYRRTMEVRLPSTGNRSTSLNASALIDSNNIGMMNYGRTNSANSSARSLSPLNTVTPIVAMRLLSKLLSTI